MSPGPNTIRKVRRSRVHLDLTTRPRTGWRSSSAVGRVSVLLCMPHLLSWTSVPACQLIKAGGTKRKHDENTVPPWPSAFTTLSCGSRGGQAIAGGLPNHRNFHAAYPPTGRLVVVRFHIPFWRRLKLSGK